MLREFFILSLIFFSHPFLLGREIGESLLDLDELRSHFILETKQIIISDYPYSFNPSLLRLHDGFLLSFRIRDPIVGTTNKMGLVFLDSSFNICSKAYQIKLPDRTSFYYAQEQDPRIVELGGALFLIFNNVYVKKKIDHSLVNAVHEIRRMCIGKLSFEGDEFQLNEIQWLLDFETQMEDKTEKNWVPFIYQNQLLLAYTISPHRIFQPRMQSTKCELFSLSNVPATWNFGELRGGTQALEVDGQYLGFFHTCKDVKTVQSEGKRMVHYFMGAYTFASYPPFQLTAMSPQPIIGPSFYQSPPYKTWKPLKVIFPGGFVCDGDHIIVSFGKQDHEIWLVKMDKKGLMQSLKTISFPNYVQEHSIP